jgi:hypothetical protein
MPAKVEQAVLPPPIKKELATVVLLPVIDHPCMTAVDPKFWEIIGLVYPLLLANVTGPTAALVPANPNCIDAGMPPDTVHVPVSRLLPLTTHPPSTLAEADRYKSKTIANPNRVLLLIMLCMLESACRTPPQVPPSAGLVC